MRIPRLSKRLAALLRVGAAAIAAPVSAETLVLRHFTLIDGTGGAPVGDSAMVVTDGRIAWVGPDARAKADKEARVVDLTGKFVMPGIIDTHVHLGLVKDGVTVNAANQTRENLEAQLRQYARYGVTTVQSLGTDQDVVLQMRDAQRATGRPAEARIYSGGLGIVVEGGYGGLAGVTKKVATPAEASAAVDREVGRHVDIVKFWLDSELGTMPKLSPEISRAVIAEGHAKKLKVVSHIFYLEDAQRVVDQGIDGLSHSVRDQPVGPALIDGMKRHKTWQMAATLAREEALFAYGGPAPWLGDPFFVQSADPATLKQIADPARQAQVSAAPHFGELRGFLKTAQANLKTLADAGIRYAMGTDAGGPMRFPGHAEHQELSLMVEAGLTPMQAIVASTASGAEFLGSKDLGTLQRGKWADLVVLDADPLTDIRNSRTIAAVYIAGRQVPSIAR